MTQQAAADRAIAREQRIQEEEQKLLAVARGEREVAERQAAAKVIQIEKTTDAETEKQLAITAAEREREAARIARPHIPLGLTLRHPLSENLASAATLHDTKGEHAGLKRVWHTGHRADQRVAVRRVRNGSVDDPPDAGRTQNRDARASVRDVVFQALEVVRIKLE